MHKDTSYYGYYTSNTTILVMHKDPKIVRKYEPVLWLLFFGLTFAVGCPAF
jgi:hypothetical protein